MLHLLIKADFFFRERQVKFQVTKTSQPFYHKIRLVRCNRNADWSGIVSTILILVDKNDFAIRMISPLSSIAFEQFFFLMFACTESLGLPVHPGAKNCHPKHCSQQDCSCSNKMRISCWPKLVSMMFILMFPSGIKFGTAS
jgi:hypothetical protein